MADYYDLGLRRAARQVCDALSEYVTILEESPDRPPEVVAGMDLVAEACAAFVACSIDATGWGNPFLPSTEPVDPEEEVVEASALPDTVVGMVQALHDLDGWRPHRYTHESRPVFELIKLSWQVEPRS